MNNTNKMPDMTVVPLADLQAMVGKEIGVSRWFKVTQERIDRFADVTEDWQFIHISPEDAAKTPFGGTIAHGFLTMSLLSAMNYDTIPRVAGYPLGVNYGFDHVRFVSPVLAGASVRGRFVLKTLDVTDDYIATCHDVTVEIEGASKPALVATWRGRAYRDPTQTG